MKICHLTSVHPQGDVRIFLKQCESLARANFQVHFVVPGGEQIIDSKVIIHAVPKSSGNRLKRMTVTVFNVYKKALSIDAEVYHFHDPELIPVGLLLKRKGKKVIYDVHEDVPRQILTKYWIPNKYKKLFSYTVERIENLVSKKFDLIVAATPHIRDRFLKIDANAIDVNNYPLLEEMKIDCSFNKKKPNEICYIGGITSERGIHTMVQALSFTKNIRLNLAGSFSNNIDKKLVEELQGWKKVNYLGYLKREEVKQVYSNSIGGLVVLHPKISYLDSLPVKMFEYMAAGIPVISSDFPLWKNIIEKNECGICVDPQNPEMIAQAIEYLYNNPEQAIKMGENGRLAVEEIFNWEKESIKLINAYNNINYTK